MQDLVQVITRFYDPLQKDKEKVGKWLEDYVKTPEAWETCLHLLQTPCPPEARLFGSQAIRQKIEYEYHKLNDDQQTSLQLTLCQIVLDASQGPRNVLRQLSVGLADIIILTRVWKDPFDQLLTFPPTIVLEVLRVLPEELVYNEKLFLDQTTRDLKSQQLKEKSQLVLDYCQSHFNNALLQKGIFEVLDAWIHSSQMPLELALPLHPLFIEALGSAEVYDIAIDTLGDLIRLVQEPSVIQSMYEKLLPFMAKIQSTENEELTHSLCRLFVECGESWITFILENQVYFDMLIKTLLFCTTLEINTVKMTFQFWFLLSEDPKLLSQETKNLYVILIHHLMKHLQYPDEEMSAEERDDFRDFRHVIGDTIKDAVRVVGQVSSLEIPFNCLKKSVQETKWQPIEASLFTLRTMCREISPLESTYLPQIMALLPLLPPHPKIKYAAILVIGRYAEWTNEHPEVLTFQLDYVSKGFDDKESISASSQTFRDLCKYCSKHVVKHMKELYPFYCHTMAHVVSSERHQMTEAIAYIISEVPPEELSSTLELYFLPIANRLSVLDGSPDSIKLAIDTTNEYSTLVRYVSSNAASCAALFQQMWPLIDRLLSIIYEEAFSESVCRLLRNSMNSYKTELTPMVPTILDKIVMCFSKTRHSCYVWILGHSVRCYSSAVFPHVEQMVHIIFNIFKESSLIELEELVSEYHYMLIECLEADPALYVGSNLFQDAWNCGMFLLDSTIPISLSPVMNYFKDVIETKEASPFVISKLPLFVKTLFKGLVNAYSHDRELIHNVTDILYAIHACIGDELFTLVEIKDMERFKRGFEAEFRLNSFLRDYCRGKVE